MVKNSPTNAGNTGDVGSIPGSGGSPGGGSGNAPPVFLPGESNGRRSLVSCSLWGRRVGTTERTGAEEACGRS